MDGKILSDQLGDDIIGIASNNDIFPEDAFIGNTANDEPDDIIIIHMDIREPLLTLRILLEEKIGVKLKNYNFWLQEAQMLESHKNLVDQCVKGEGLVQINVQIQTISERINIVDVLKPTEAALALEAIKAKNNLESNPLKNKEPETNGILGNVVKEEPKENVVNWILDNKFNDEQIRLKIPEDPCDWTHSQVKHWLNWAIKEFNLTQIKLSDWDINGVELCNLSLEDFQLKIPHDPGNVFWTHLELLRKCKFVAVIQRQNEDDDSIDETPIILKRDCKVIRRPINSIVRQCNLLGNINVPQLESGSLRSGNNGQIQLWQFLLDLLTDKEYKTIIQWVGEDGEFKLSDPEKVAQLWGERKNKPAMNYEKLSRALRYYYDGDMISKVQGRRFVYKFVCNLKQLIGYNALELSNLVNECLSNAELVSINTLDL